MKIKLKTIMAGPDGNAQPDDVIEVDKERGRRLVDGGFAVEADKPEAKKQEPEEVETATVQAEEAETSGPQRRKPGRPRKDSL